jgi:DNA primase
VSVRRLIDREQQSIRVDLMAEAGSFADKVKQQADIVRLIGEYVRLKKSGQSFQGLCPFHQEKSPSFNVNPTRQMFYCFGCNKGGDIFTFVQEMEKCEFPEAVRLVAEKSGISIPQAKPRSPEERRENQARAVLQEMHREAQTFFAKQLASTAEGKAASAYLQDRGLNAETITRFGIGYAPAGGDVLLRHFKQKYPEKLLVDSGLISRDQTGRLFDRFRRRITFPISNESSKIVAFGCRALGDDQPKYLNSPETPIYSKSNILYHLDRAKEGIRREDFAILVEGYMDAIAVARAGLSNVVASCGTSLAEQQIKLLARFTKRIIVNYDPDTAGQAATERSLTLLLEHDFEVHVLALPPIGEKKADPDLFIREKGAKAYIQALKESQPYVDYLIARARKMDLTSGEGKLRALNFLMPYLQRIPNALLRSEWATRISHQLRIDEPILRAALSKAANERRGQVGIQPELSRKSVKDAERYLIQVLIEPREFRREMAEAIQIDRLHEGLETERVFAALIVAALSERPIETSEIAALLEEQDKRMLYEVLFNPLPKVIRSDVDNCLAVLRVRKAKFALSLLQRQLGDQVTKGNSMAETLELQKRIDEARGVLSGLDVREEEQKSRAKEGPDEVQEDINRMIADSLRRVFGRG